MMPLHELYRKAKEKLDCSKEINSTSAPDHSTAPESDFYELVWENGQISMQGQSSSRGRKIPTCKSLTSHCPKGLQHRDVVGYGNGTNNVNMMRMGKFGDSESGLNEIRMPAPSAEDEDVIHWLNYGMDESLPHDYGSDFIHELSGVTMHEIPPLNNLSLLDKRSNSNQVLRDSHKNYARHAFGSEQGILNKDFSVMARGEIEIPGPKPSTSQFCQPSSYQCQGSFASVRSKASEITENNGSNPAHQVPCGELTQIFPSASSGFSGLKLDKQDQVMCSSSSTIMNFSHFARPAAIVKANLQNIGLSSSRSDGIENKKKDASATASNPPESTKAGFSGERQKQSAVHELKVVEPSKADLKQLEPSKADLKQLEPKSLEVNATVLRQSDPARKEDVSKIYQSSNLLLCESTNKGEEAVVKNMEPAVASSSVCSGNGAERISGNPNQSLKRKRQETEDSECHSEDVEEESVDVKKAGPTRGVKRSRSAEVHNLSERRRRDRINEKMRALQDLIPNCNKVRLFILSNLEPYLLLLEPKMQPEKQRNETKRQEAWQVYGALLCAVGQCMHEKAKIFSNLLSPTRASSRPKAMIAMSSKRKASTENLMQQQQPPLKKLATDGPGGVVPMNSMSVDMQMQGSAGAFSTMMGVPNVGVSSMARQISNDNTMGREVGGQQSKVSSILAQAWKDDIDAGQLLSSVYELFGESLLSFIPKAEAGVFL